MNQQMRLAGMLFRLVFSGACKGFKLALLPAFVGLLSLSPAAGAAPDSSNGFILERAGRVISLEPYAPNIIRVTISTVRAHALMAPGFGFVGAPSANGWTRETAADGAEIFRSPRMTVRLGPADLPAPRAPWFDAPPP